MDWSFLAFVGEPSFVVPWYLAGALGACFVIYDMRHANSVLKPAMKWAWPIIVLFFSVIGLALYFATARAPRIGELEGMKEKQEAHDAYEAKSLRRVSGAVIHCVAGDGFGIMTAMVIARAGGMSFWQEFWFEYLVGFVIGWFVFQRKSMTMMTDSLPKQLAMAFRGEFFSMLTVMGGMGAVMTYVTPMVVTAQPKPLTFAFWGFGMLGLLVGFALTYPMNWLMLKLGWKHGMGGMEGAEEMRVEEPRKRYGIIAAMSVMGAAALVLVALLTHARETAPLRGEVDAFAVDPQGNTGEELADGIAATLGRAQDALRGGDRTRASMAMDESLRAAEAGTHSAPGSFYSALEQIREARVALQQANEARALERLRTASALIERPATVRPAVLEVERYRGATVIDSSGAILGEVTRASGDSFDLALGGWRDVFGFIDLGAARRVTIPTDRLAFGPPSSARFRVVVVPRKAEATAAAP